MSNWKGVGKEKDVDKGPKYVTGKKNYKKECTLRIDDIPNEDYSPEKVIDAAEKVCGLNTILAVVPSDNRLFYDITTDSEENALLLTHGLDIDGKHFKCSLQFSNIFVVSFMHLPAYVEDDAIIEALTIRGCELKSDIFRHVHPSTQVADGTRYATVKFPPGMVSLPWSMKFQTILGQRHFRVKHNHQKSLCNKCGSPDHLYKKCPQLICDRCDEQGHKIRDCTAERCNTCNAFPNKCFCQKPEDKACHNCKQDPCKCVCEYCNLDFETCKCGLNTTNNEPEVLNVYEMKDTEAKVNEEEDKESLHSEEDDSMEGDGDDGEDSAEESVSGGGEFNVSDLDIDNGNDDGQCQKKDQTECKVTLDVTEQSETMKDSCTSGVGMDTDDTDKSIRGMKRKGSQDIVVDNEITFLPSEDCNQNIDNVGSDVASLKLTDKQTNDKKDDFTGSSLAEISAGDSDGTKPNSKNKKRKKKNKIQVMAGVLKDSEKDKNDQNG